MSRFEEDIPEPWRTAMGNAGAYSFRQLAAKARVGTSSVTNLIYGRTTSREGTMQAVADTLRLPVTTIREWASTARGEVGPYSPPAEANRLSERQRRAIDELIRSIVAALPEEQRGGQLIDLARLPLPDASRLAARRGTSEGRRLAEDQDRDAENP